MELCTGIDPGGEPISPFPAQFFFEAIRKGKHTRVVGWLRILDIQKPVHVFDRTVDLPLKNEEGYKFIPPLTSHLHRMKF